MARRYTIAANYSMTAGAAKDVLRISGVRGVTRLIELHVTNDADETSEMLPFEVGRCTSDGTGTGVTPMNLDPSDSSCSASVSYGLSAAVTGKTIHHRESCNILSGFHYVPTPEARPAIGATGRLYCGIMAGPTNTLTISVNAVIEEEA